VFTVLAGLCTIGATLYMIYCALLPSPSPPSAHLSAELLRRYDGFYVRVVNTGRITATGVNVKVVTWRVGAPAADVRQDTPVHNLPPGDDSEFRIVLTPARFGADLDEKSLYSGYIVVSSTESSAPRTWAFSIPVETLSVVADNGRWPLVEVRADLPKPFLTCVDVPQGICTNGERQTLPDEVIHFHSNPVARKRTVIDRLAVNREKERPHSTQEVSNSAQTSLTAASNIANPNFPCELRENLRHARAFFAIGQWKSAADYFYEAAKCVDESQVDNSKLIVAKSHYEHSGFEDAAIAFERLFSKL
jgi:hypothetical protein